MSEIIIAKSAGFCFGVRRAVDMALQTAQDGPCLTVGSIVHNHSVIESLRAGGVDCVENWREAPDATLIIRSHGLGRADWEAIHARQAKTVDATCPCVARMQRLAADCEAEGGTLIVVGSRQHPEVQGVAGWCSTTVIVENSDELADFLATQPPETPLTMMVQTTTIRKKWEDCIKIFKKSCTNGKILDTICKATDARQQEAAELAAICDGMVVVGDRASANTEKLVKLCQQSCKHVVWVENAAQWPRGCMTGITKIGLTAGASTPSWSVEEVVIAMTEELNEVNVTAEEQHIPEQAAGTPASTGEQSFEEMLEQSFKTLSTGDRVNAYVVAITPTEVQLDLGTKHAGYIPIGELSDDPDAKPEEIAPVGSTIEVFVVRVNDQEGVVMCSKKKIDALKHFDEMEKAVDEGIMMEGIVTEENRGGVVVSVKGVRVFVPVSQTGLPRETPLSTLMKQRVKLYVTEFNRARKRIVGSIRKATGDARSAASAKIWETLAVGDTFDGVVKSMTTYGVFVDIGGIDGMVHISELSWGRVKTPSDVCKVGDPMKVRVIKLDPEKRKISLSAKDPSQDPWTKFIEAHKVNDIVPVKIVKFMTFGAFAEVLPGVDGLIHISEVAHERINKLSDALSEGQVVNARIINIDEENHKISLSIKATLERAPEEVAEGEDEVVASADAPVEEACADEADVTIESGDGVVEVTPDAAEAVEETTEESDKE